MSINQTLLKYQRVEAEIRKLARNLPAGAKLPAERILAASFDCNFLTVRKALKHLVKDGTVIRRIGSGTFIARYPMETEEVAEQNTIGILVAQNGNDYSARLLRSIAQISQAEKINSRSIWVENLGDSTIVLANQSKREGCGVLMLPWFSHDRIDEVRRFISQSPLPVCVALAIPGLENNCCYQESSSAIDPVLSACRYFRALGHKRIAFLGPDTPSDVILQKMIVSYSIFTSRERLPAIFGLLESGAQAVDDLAVGWKEYCRDLAVVSYDDEHAIRFITAMHKQGLSSPADFCVIGNNDTEGSRFTDPPLSTIHQDFDHMARSLIKSAQAMIQGRISQSTDGINLKILVRDSCGGRQKITNGIRQQLEKIELVVAENPNPDSGPELDAEASG